MSLWEEPLQVSYMTGAFYEYCNRVAIHHLVNEWPQNRKNNMGNLCQNTVAISARLYDTSSRACSESEMKVQLNETLEAIRAELLEM